MIPKNEIGKIAEYSNDIICTIDKKGRFVWINRAVENILGYTPSEVTGQIFLGYIIKEDRIDTKKITRRLLEGDKVQNFVTRFKHKGGRIVTIEWIGNWDEEDQLLYCIGNDKTEFLRTKENYRNLFHQSPLPQYVYDLQTLEFVDMNNAALKLYKYKKEDLSKINLMDLRPKEDASKLFEAIKKYQGKSDNEVINFGVFTHLDKNGKHLKIDLTGQKIELDGRECAMVIGKDVTAEYRNSTYKQTVSNLSILFNKGHDLNGTIREILKYLVDIGELQLGEVWLQGRENDHVKLIESYPVKLEASGQIQEFKSGMGLPGTTWKQKKTIIWDEIQLKKNFVRLNAAKKAGIKSVIGVPLCHEKKIYGILLFGSKKPVSELDDMVHLFRNLEQVLGSEVHRKSLEDDFNRIFETVPDILCKVDFETSIKRINKAGSALLGYKEKELRKIKFFDLIFEPDREKTRKFISEIQDQKDHFDCEFRIKKKSGEVIWLSWSFKKYDEYGIHYAIAKNVTNQKEQQILIDGATNLARIGGWEIDLKTNEVYWSPMTKKIHGVDPDYDVNLEKALSFFKKEVRDEVKQRIKLTSETGKPWDFEMPIIRANGEECWVKSIGQVIYNNGEPEKLMGSLQDIHEKKIAQLEIEELYKERNRILESISDAFFAVNREWTVTYWNNEAERILGTKSSDIVGKNLWEVYEDAVELDFYHQYHKAMKTGKLVNFEEYYPALEKWFDVTAYPSEGGLSVYFKDISFKKLSDEKVRLSNERFEKVAKATSDIIYDWDLKNETLFQGEGFRELFGYDLDKLPDNLNSWERYLHPDDADEVLESLMNAISDKKTHKWQKEYRYIKSNGEIAYIVDKGEIIRDENGKAIRMVGAMSDITERKMNEKSLQKLNRELKKHAKELSDSNAELEQFAYVASHDLQEPLRMITSFLTQLEKNYKDELDERASQYIHYAVDGAKRMRQIILDLLDFSRVGKNLDNLEEIDLNDLIEEICNLYSNRIEEKSAKIIKKQLPVIISNKTAIFQIFQNLISNSIKYAKENEPPEIIIAAEEFKEVYQFTVRDNGIGIGKEYYEKVFVLFQRLHGRDEYSGSGMGLSIVKKWIENLGGQIWIRSKVGEGTTFTFTIAKRKS